MAALAARKFFIYHAGPPTGFFFRIFLRLLFKLSSDSPQISPGFSRSVRYQPRTTSWRHHRAPRRPGRRRAPTPEELRQAAIPPANTSSSPLFSAPLNRTDKIERPSEERPGLKLYLTLQGAGTGQAAPVKRTNKCCVVPTVFGVFLSHSPPRSGQLKFSLWPAPLGRIVSFVTHLNLLHIFLA
jgi:hypothetical protein